MSNGKNENDWREKNIIFDGISRRLKTLYVIVGILTKGKHSVLGQMLGNNQPATKRQNVGSCEYGLSIYTRMQIRIVSIQQMERDYTSWYYYQQPCVVSTHPRWLLWRPLVYNIFRITMNIIMTSIISIA
jgi:hypothetical protein